ncbi:hypothetical protein ACLOJK_019168 [Asimina triloba]
MRLDMVMAKPCETDGKAVDRVMCAKKDKDLRADVPRTRINEVARRNSTDAIGIIWDATTSNQGLILSAGKSDTDQRTTLVEWYVIGVICWDILLGSVLRREHQTHNSRKTRIDQQEDQEYDSRICRSQEGGSRPTYLHLTLGRHKSL